MTINKIKSETIISDSPGETKAAGARLGMMLNSGDIVLLSGELGAGKTTFVQGVCLGLGVENDSYVRSPTFTLMNEYKGRVSVRHIDLYRIDSSYDFESTGIFDPAFDGVTLIEWAEKMLVDIVGAYLKIEITDESEFRRVIKIDKYDEN